MLILESLASEKAEKNKLKYLGFGRYISPISKKLYVSDGEKLKPYVRKIDRIAQFNNVKSTLGKEEFDEISERIRKGKIKYTEKCDSEENRDKFLLNQGLTGPDFVFAYVPKKVYNTDFILHVIVEIHGKYMEFKSYDDNGFYCWHILEKRNKNSYKAYIKYLRVPEHMVGTSKTIRDYMYNLINFYNTMKVTEIVINCGHEHGVYMWSRYGADFVSAEQRKKYLIGIKDKMKNEIIRKANENDEFNSVLKDIYSKIVNCRNLWEISRLTIKLSNNALQYIKERLPGIDSFIKNGILYAGEMLMNNTAMYAVISLYQDSASYKQYYNYITFKKTKPKNMIKESKLIVEKKDNTGLELFPSPFYVINDKVKDVDVWDQDTYDRMYQVQSAEELNAGF